ncbi:MAG: class I SAM-dependent methyltransferase, partial [Candidatus Binatia bacterium]
PAAIDREWPTPPVEHGAARTREPVTPRRAFDLELLEELNREYETRRTVPEPPRYDASSIAGRARSRLMKVHARIDLLNQRVLEVGCGPGFEVWFLGNQFGCEAHGVDIVEWTSWTSLAGERARYTCADLAKDHPYPADFFDRAISFTVWEHIRHPQSALAELYRILRPGGLAWIRANLHRGATASHRYRDIYFPWPHLLFSDDVVSEFFRKRGKPESGWAWVNRLTWDEYVRCFGALGFAVRMARFDRRPLDEAFYRRFEDVLGRYPVWDLTTEYFTVVLQKPGKTDPREKAR